MVTLEQKIDSLPFIFQGGMGIGVSDWRLANAVSTHKLTHKSVGIVSGSGIDTVLLRRLQMGDDDGSMRRAMEKFPIAEIAEKVYEDFYIEGGKSEDVPFKKNIMFGVKPRTSLMQLNTLANFVEVFLAKEGHNNPVGINYLEKLQIPHLSGMYGAMLAGVDYVVMGAGMPLQVPGVLDTLSQHKEMKYVLDVTGAAKNSIFTRFNPKKIIGDVSGELKRPDFIGIVASNLAASLLKSRSSGKVDGFVVEGPTAGGHNAPPRVKNKFSESGEPLYGPRDIVDLEKLSELDLPFWLAGGKGNSTSFLQSLGSGATGVQVGSLFSLANESAYHPKLKTYILDSILNGNLDVYTDSSFSPTGYPFKVLQLPETLSDELLYLARERECDLGYLRENYLKENGRVAYRCASEPIFDFSKKGGELKNTADAGCLCNALFSNVGLGQMRLDGTLELPLFTAGDDINSVKEILKKTGTNSYSALDVLDHMYGNLK